MVMCPSLHLLVGKLIPWSDTMLCEILCQCLKHYVRPVWWCWLRPCRQEKQTQIQNGRGLMQSICHQVVAWGMMLMEGLSFVLCCWRVGHLTAAVAQSILVSRAYVVGPWRASSLPSWQFCSCALCASTGLAFTGASWHQPAKSFCLHIYLVPILLWVFPGRHYHVIKGLHTSSLSHSSIHIPFPQNSLSPVCQYFSFQFLDQLVKSFSTTCESIHILTLYNFFFHTNVLWDAPPEALLTWEHFPHCCLSEPLLSESIVKPPPFFTHMYTYKAAHPCIKLPLFLLGLVLIDHVICK